MSAPQGSAEWLQERCGNATASEFSSVLAKGQGKTRTAYLRRLVAERLTGKPMETYKNAHMERGQEQEPYARMAYEASTGRMVEEVGFIKHPKLRAGCSPDGLIGDESGAEIKSVIATVQLETILAGDYPTEHRAQIQGSMWITGRKTWDFCSYCHDMPENLQLYVFTVARDDAYIMALEAEVVVFLNDVESLVERLLKRSA